MDRQINPEIEKLIEDEVERRVAAKLAETAIQDVAGGMHLPAGDIPSIEGVTENPKLADIIDAPAIQSLMEDFYTLARIPVSIIDLKGNVLVGVGWQEICVKYHRAQPEACKHCVESDTLLTAGIPKGEFRLYKCKNNMWEAATPIIIGGQHLGNILSGQFFFEDELVDEEPFRAQARKFGFDEKKYLAALKAVPRLSREALSQAMAFFLKLADLLSRQGYSNLKLARSLAERDTLTESLRESESRLNRAQEIAHLGSWELDLVNDTLTWSDEVYRIFGLEPQEFGATYEAFLQAVHPEDRAAVDAAYSESVREGRDTYEIEHRIVKKSNGETRIVHEKCEHIRDGSGRIVRSIGMVHDITRHKQAEEALRESQNQLQTILESAPAGILVSASDGSFIFRNRLSEEILGGQVTGNAFDSERGYTIHHLDGSLFQSNDLPLSSALRGESAKDEELLIRYQNGEEKIVLASAMPIVTASGRISGAVATMLDITERKKAEEAMRESEERYRSLFENAHDLIQILGPDGRFLYVNRAWLQIMDYGEEEVPTMSVFDVISPGCLERCRDIFQQMMSGEPIMDIETEFINKSGEKIILEGNTHPRMKEGQVVSVQCIFRDITGRKRAEEELQKIQKLESIGILAGGIAHDFNNILTILLGNIELARMSLPPEDKASKRLIVAEEAVVRAKGITHQLLTFARGGAPIKKTISVESLIRKSVEFALRGSNLSSDFSFPNGLWLVEVDEDQMLQVINNLAINASHAMPEGGAFVVSAQNEYINRNHVSDLEEGKYVRIDFTDQGVGIPEEHLGLIFDPYFTTKESGSGLGLAISHSIIKRHGGTITVHSVLGEGSSFMLFLPASEKKEIGPEGPEHQKPFSGRGKILVMDDEETVNDIATDMLRHLGCRVETVKNGAEAIKAYKEALITRDPFDVVIADLTIPGGEGSKEIVRHLLELDPQAQVIVSSGYANDPIMSDFAEYGFKGVIPKPYKLIELNKTLQELLGAKKK
jgi:two-component system cell cycle sensor histidine kinase/response regulator CckA